MWLENVYDFLHLLGGLFVTHRHYNVLGLRVILMTGCLIELFCYPFKVSTYILQESQQIHYK